jgi:hypothetical protein
MKLLFIFVILFVFAAPSYAATKCTAADIIRTDLTTKYNEVLVRSIMLPDVSILEVYASNNHLTWSIIVVDPSEEMACMVDYGGGQNALTAAIDEYLGPPT